MWEEGSKGKGDRDAPQLVELRRSVLDRIVGEVSLENDGLPEGEVAPVDGDAVIILRVSVSDEPERKRAKEGVGTRRNSTRNETTHCQYLSCSRRSNPVVSGTLRPIRNTKSVLAQRGREEVTRVGRELTTETRRGGRGSASSEKSAKRGEERKELTMMVMIIPARANLRARSDVEVSAPSERDAKLEAGRNSPADYEELGLRFDVRVKDGRKHGAELSTGGGESVAGGSD